MKKEVAEAKSFFKNEELSVCHELRAEQRNIYEYSHKLDFNQVNNGGLHEQCH